MVEGRVQGVGYRQWFAGEARALGLAGWVRNRASGCVEAIVTGPEEAIDRLLTAAHRGPRLAAVSRIEAREASEENFSDFSIRATQ